MAEPWRDRDEQPTPYTVATFHPFLDETPAERLEPYDPSHLEAIQKGYG